jgi:hypothetical protein
MSWTLKKAQRHWAAEVYVKEIVPGENFPRTESEAQQYKFMVDFRARHSASVAKAKAEEFVAIVQELLACGETVSKNIASHVLKYNRDMFSVEEQAKLEAM